VLRQVLAALDGAENVLARAIQWAATAGEAALAIVGEVLTRAGHTVDDILLWVQQDALSGLRAVVRGMLAAGATAVSLMAWAASRTLQIMRDVVAELIASGVTLADLVADTLVQPQDALRNLVQAFKDLGKTLQDIIGAAVVQPAQDAARRVLQALKDMGEDALDVLKAAFDVSASAAATVFTLLLEWFPGSYRPLSDSERADADKIFGSAVPLDQVRLAVLSLPVDFIEWVNGGRTFTTMFLINFASWAEIKIETLIHELTHVWQGMVAGPVYMVEALEAQASAEGYNYGYTDSETGEGAQGRLNAAGGDFSVFNREQQAQIIMHYFVRRYEKTLDFTAWQPYANIVHA
jgi:hypothetical protein